jgi:hypothetical protein
VGGSAIVGRFSHSLSSLMQLGLHHPLEVISNSVPKQKTHNGIRTFAVQEIRLQHYLLGENFSPVPVKCEHFIYINSAPPY